jgi:hypothetical protein
MSTDPTSTPSYEAVLRAYDAREIERRRLWPAEFSHSASHGHWTIAYHEAGHAVVAAALGYPVEFVEVRGKYDSDGRMQPTPEAYLDAPIADRLAIKLAGAAAEELHYPPLSIWNEFDRLDGHDIREARSMIAAHLGVEPSAEIVYADLVGYRARAAHLVGQHWPWVDRVARSLARRRELSGADVLALRISDRE